MDKTSQPLNGDKSTKNQKTMPEKCSKDCELCELDCPVLVWKKSIEDSSDLSEGKIAAGILTTPEFAQEVALVKNHLDYKSFGELFLEFSRKGINECYEGLLKQHEDLPSEGDILMGEQIPSTEPETPDEIKIEALKAGLQEILDCEYCDLGDFVGDIGLTLFNNHHIALTLGERTKILLDIIQSFLISTDTKYLDDVQANLQSQEPELYDDLRKHPAAPYFFV